MAHIRLAITVQGTVQGVGFRPFVYRLAQDLGLTGFVRNQGADVVIEVQGEASATDAFVERLSAAPEHACIAEILVARAAISIAETSFAVLSSDTTSAQPWPSLPADLAICDACKTEIRSETERRFEYPFTNCSHCGPRYTIVERLPYDRTRTSMTHFPMCAACKQEYENPPDRRFHAEPIACETCGPTLSLLERDGRVLKKGASALAAAVSALTTGQIIALKGLGGFQLLVDASHAEAVATLRHRKGRPDKPLAVLFQDLDAVRAECRVSNDEARVLASAVAPIVLLEREENYANTHVANNVAPNNPHIGAMLPNTALHWLLCEKTCRPLVCTSGNLSDEPLCIETEEAQKRLSCIADLFLVHDRPIVRPVDDSVARVTPLGTQVLRRARGYAPGSIATKRVHTSLLAFGGQLKNTVAVSVPGRITLSQHVGDLFSIEGRARHALTADELLTFTGCTPTAVVCDAHPGYASTDVARAFAESRGIALELVQHHHAHVAACIAEHALSGPVLGLAWDGAGYGTDTCNGAMLWGGEALIVNDAEYKRVASLRPFRLPGNEYAMRDPRRAALSLLYEVYGSTFDFSCLGLNEKDLPILLTMLRKGLESPLTTSMGRLFDAASVLCGAFNRPTTFEGQAAMALEFAAHRSSETDAYTFPLDYEKQSELWIGNWEPCIRAIMSDRAEQVDMALISARFHNTLASFALEIAQKANVHQVALTGGCFQNARLLTHVSAGLKKSGFDVFTPLQYPPNDGGLSLGQIWVASHRMQGDSLCA